MFKLNAKRPLVVLVMAAAVASIAACGGGSDGGAVDGGTGGAGGASAMTSVPASALASVNGFVAFMNQLIDTGTNDTSEPIALGDASMPIDDSI